MLWRCLIILSIFFTFFIPINLSHNNLLHAKTTQSTDKNELIIGVLAHRGGMVDYTEYENLAKILTQKSSYNYKILPITFNKITTAIKENQIDFIITNPSLYVELEHQFGIMRIATLQGSFNNNFATPKFGGVLFTSSKNNKIKDIQDIQESQIIAVDKNSFGGYVVLWYELMRYHGIDISKDVIFEGSHDGVVKRILSNPSEIGIVRTDIIERMSNEGSLSHGDIRILNPKMHPKFSFLCSTKLYPEWAFATLPKTPLKLAEETLVHLLHINRAESSLIWTIPLDYGDIHEVHKYLKLPPYDIPFSIQDFIQTYKFQIFIAIFILFFTLLLLIKLFLANKKYNHINVHLHKIVEEKTQALTQANQHLKSMVDTDELTQIASRRYFYTNSNNYFQLCLRNDMPLFLLSLDIDHFKKVNDTYGHQIGDEVLHFFCSNVSQCLRKSDIFGRVGGEEFGICAIDITSSGALELAEKIRHHIEITPFNKCEISINLTVSIGIAQLDKSDTTIETIVTRADKALYKAKESGRNRIEIWDEL